MCVSIGVKIFVLHPDSVLKLALVALCCSCTVVFIVCPKTCNDKSVFEESCSCSAEPCIFSLNALCRCGKPLQTPENMFNTDACTIDSAVSLLMQTCMFVCLRVYVCDVVIYVFTVCKFTIPPKSNLFLSFLLCLSFFLFSFVTVSVSFSLHSFVLFSQRSSLMGL